MSASQHAFIGIPGFASLTAQTTGTGESIPINASKQAMWEVQGVGTITSGEVKIETAGTFDYTGQWNEIGSVLGTDISGGKSLGGTYPAPPGNFMRARISTTIAGGGTTTAYLNSLLG